MATNLVPLQALELALLDHQQADVRAFFDAADLASGNEALMDAGHTYGFPTYVHDDVSLTGHCVMLARDLARLMYGDSSTDALGKLLRSYGCDFIRIEGLRDDLKTLLRQHFSLNKFDGKAAFATWEHFLIVGMYGQTEQARKVKAYLLKREQAARIADKVEESTGMSPRQLVMSNAGDLLVQMAEAYREQERQLHALQLQQQHTDIKATHATENALRALESQLFFTIAEYVYINHLQRQLPDSAYKACSDHLRLYCLDNGIPFRKIGIGGKAWSEEYAYHVSVFTDALPGWLCRRQAQTELRVIHTIPGGA